jgi:16S rRNA (cytosine1402-N4)-methyltransferase
MTVENKHFPVMPEQVINYLEPEKNGFYLDATLGSGGHADLIARSLSKKGRVIAVDQDVKAIEKAKINLIQHKDKIIYFHDNFENLTNILKQLKIKKINGALFDLGVSTCQLKSFSRGFSFNQDPENLNTFLDMRMDQSQKTTAFDIINQYQEKQLLDVFLNLAEEPYGSARKLAKNIVLKRKIKPIKTVNDLLEVIKTSFPSNRCLNKRKIHYATNVFRAIRMETNQELSVLKKVLPETINFLEKRGRLVVVSFHSLEDRIVKQTFKHFALESKVKILTKKPITADYLEIKENPPSSSAKLRAMEKL